jgi:hypothetical protein
MTLNQVCWRANVSWVFQVVNEFLATIKYAYLFECLNGIIALHDFLLLFEGLQDLEDISTVDCIYILQLTSFTWTKKVLIPVELEYVLLRSDTKVKVVVIVDSGVHCRHVQGMNLEKKSVRMLILCLKHWEFSDKFWLWWTHGFSGENSNFCS